METIKINFHGIDSLSEGIAILSDDLGIEASCECSADICLTVNETEEHILTASLDGKNASITYGGGKARFFRALAVVVQWVKDGETEKTVTEKPLFSVNGAMVDMSRDAVMNVSTVKFMLRKMALMGLNTYMLYTEDTYEVEGRPYFGYMRGRYTADEIRELDAYAIKLGIELVPCVQMLGHLATHLRWTATAPYKDTANALLAGADETYRLIDDMLKTISECFTTKRIHIGMDETHDLGTGKAIDEYGYREKRDLYFEHLQKVSEMCRSYGFIPMIWSDMFYKLTGKGLDKNHDYYVNAKLPDNIRELVPEEVQPVFWDYYATDEDVYLKSIDNHAGFAADTIFAGGIWTWNSYGLFASYLKTKTLPGLEACRKKGVKEVFATIWNSGGYTASMITSLAGLAWYASYDYNGGHDDDLVKECFRYSCGRDFSDFEKLELCEHLPDGCGYGGSCFPTDVKALIRSGAELGYHMRILEAVEAVNEKQKTIPFAKLKAAMPELAGKNIAVWGLAFKPGTDDMREAPSLTLISSLLEHGCNVRTFDPVATAEAKRRLGEGTITYCDDMYEACIDADALVIVTDWKQFRVPSWAVLRKTMRGRLIVDGRNLYEPEEAAAEGFDYKRIG